jgi:hypothetical protein
MASRIISVASATGTARRLDPRRTLGTAFHLLPMPVRLRRERAVAAIPRPLTAGGWLDSFPVGLNRERVEFALFAVLSEPSGGST